MNSKWIPEIMYEEDANGMTRGLPFVDVPLDKSMPSMIFVYESRNLKESIEEEVEREIILHSYANMTILKQELDNETFNKVRLVLGLEPLLEAEKAGQKIINAVKTEISDLIDNKETQDV
tara:strand:+ start:191 stop:550 length:360 start_codon:yes stop_codon:yes gene_type:complete